MNPRETDFGLSPCPNDTFAFHAALHGLVDTHGWRLRPPMAGVEELNRLALVFDQIMPAVAAGRFEAGLIIHEGRFTFEGHGLLPQGGHALPAG